MTENVRKLKELIDNSHNIVFFGGAGVSTDTVPLVPIFKRIPYAIRLYFQK